MGRLCFVISVVFIIQSVTATPDHHRFNNLIQQYQQWTGYGSNIHSKDAILSDSITDENGKVRTKRGLGPSGMLNPSAQAVNSSMYQISDTCMEHTEMYLENLIGMERWAMMMFDAGGKLQSEIFRMNTNWMGSFDECLDAVATIVHNSTGVATVEKPFRGRYCTLTIPFVNMDVLPESLQDLLLSPYMSPGVLLGVCVPNSCSSEDVKGLISAGLSFIPSSVFAGVGSTMLPFPGLPLADVPSVYIADCPEETVEWDTKAIACMTVVALFAAIMVIATVYDYLALDRAKEGRLQQALLSFSVYTNGAKILNTKSPPGSLTCLNGIRFLSMTWVLYGHIYTFAPRVMQSLMSKSTELMKDISYQAIANALVSVDTFFTISGILVSYLSLKEMKRGGMINMGMFYFHRFWRLTPPFMFIMMIYITLFRYWGDGPFWPQGGLEKDFCSDNWWTNLIYLANFLKQDTQQCMAWAWYLMNDMQMYIVSPIIFVSLFYSKWLGGIVSMVFLLGTGIATGAISKYYHLPPSMVGGGVNRDANADYFEVYYVKPYCRMGPYILGMITGYFMYKTDCKVKMNKAVVLFGWLASTFCALAVLYGLYDGMNPNIPYGLSENVSALFNAASRTVWGGCICWVVFACCTGYGGIVNTILSWSALLPLARLTYMMYLIHPVVISWWAFRQRQLFYHTTQNMIYLFIGTLLICYAAAFVLSMAFEAPFMGLEKVIFPKKKKGSQPKNDPDVYEKIDKNGLDKDMYQKMGENGLDKEISSSGHENGVFTISDEKPPLTEVPNYVEVLENYGYENAKIKL